MEDEDGEPGNMDMWKLHNNITNDSISVKETLMRANGTQQHLDNIEDPKDKRDRSNCQQLKPKASNAPQIISCVPYKGYKKRILAQTQENQTSRGDLSALLRLPGGIPKGSLKDRRQELPTKRGNKIAEYTQYLGLQPSTNYLGPSRNGPIALSSRPNCALPTMAPSMATAGPSTDMSSLPHTPNFNRKVYLCSACNTYFENWHLFLHMREIHERHICLFCLGLFDQVERLSHHLSKNHSIPETEYTSVEDFHRIFRGSCYLICCSCEKVFTESDNFYNHYCAGTKQSSKQTTNICSVCKQVDSHLRTCSMAPDTEDELSPTTAKEVNRKMRYNKLKQAKVRRSLSNFETKKGVKGGVGKSTNATANAVNVNNVAGAVSEDLSNASMSSQTMSSTRDTVAETIMEVSRCVSEVDATEEGFREEVKEKDATMRAEDETMSREDEHCGPSVAAASIDAVTEDKNEVAVSKSADEETLQKKDDETNETDETIAEDMNTTSPTPANQETDVRLQKSSPEQQPAKTLSHTISDFPAESTQPLNGERSASPTSSRSSSPTMVSHSLFSPPHTDTPAAIGSSNNEPEVDAPNSSLEEPEAEQKQEHVTVSFNAVPSSDRSLVFKICTNKNSFSISKSNKSDNIPRESEENNNGQASTSESRTQWNHCDKDSEGSAKENECESDSDSERLAVIDSNESEIENKDEEEDEDDEQASKSISVEKVNDEQEADKMETEEQEDVSRTKEAEETMEIEETKAEEGDGIALAGGEIPSIDLNVEGILETMEIDDLLKKCISAASPTCVFCNHARLVAVNGKQLGLHMLAEHRFQPQHPAIIIQMEQFITKVKKCLPELESSYFNLDSYDTQKGTYNVPITRIYECFHCRFYSTVHKELYLHNRKMHQKSIILCVMCKSTFHSYSELLCHLCPGIYAANTNIRYRCCLCPVSNLPSAFRLMVHLRKVHHACDVCLESTGNQQRLSNHVWKHKLHHLCYRCGISYRNKPDITKHLFWKHGTESVLCKKCLQKKWPHVYHFCIPPTAFVCEECNTTFSRAVALKVHKRLHSNDHPYSCSECTEKFVSRKLLRKHEESHRAPPPVEVVAPKSVAKSPSVDENAPITNKVVKDNAEKTDKIDPVEDEKKEVKEKKEPIKKVDVLDLPPLNLSSESDSESDQEIPEKKTEPEQVNKEEPQKTATEPTEVESLVRSETADNIVEVERDEEEKKQEARIMDGIWDNFKSYTASLKSEMQKLNGDNDVDIEFLKSVILAEHDYWIVYPDENTEVNGEASEKVDALSDTPKSPTQVKDNSASETLESPKKKVKSPKKAKKDSSSSSSDSSSDDSSSCTCGTNCSCSSSSSNSSSSSSSSSDSDSSDTESSPKKPLSSRKDRKKETAKKNVSQSSEVEPKIENKEPEPAVEENVVDIVQTSPVKSVAAPRESDLDTDETLTDEDFYDEHPQLLALKALAEKRNQQLLLLASVAETPPAPPVMNTLNNGIGGGVEPVAQVANVASGFNEKPTKGRKKVKNKKRKKTYKPSKTKNQAKPTVESIKLNIPKSFYQKKSAATPSQVSVVSPSPAGIYATSTPKVQPMKLVNQNVTLNTPENENKRSSKRKRVPKRFYGDSSDEENDKQLPKWRKAEPSFVIRQPVAPPAPVLPPIPPIIVAPPPAPAVYYQPPATTDAAASGSDSDEAAESSSDSDSEPEQTTNPMQPQQQHQQQFLQQQQIMQQHQQRPNTLPHPPERNLYCYCHCPYDEVSEMIACDASDCRIEWFHFECVGIMVPPKGKWYCPDCRRRLGLPQTSEEIAN